MSKSVYCSECGMKLNITKKALKGYGLIINLVEPHECLNVPVELDLTPSEIPIGKEAGGKFVQNLNKLRPSQVNQTNDLRDRRKDPDIKTSAPPSIIQQTKNLMNSSEPENSIESDPDV